MRVNLRYFNFYELIFLLELSEKLTQKRSTYIKGKNALGQRQLCRDRHKCSTYPKYRDNEVRLYVINMDKSKGGKLKLVPNNKRKCDAIYKYLLLVITMVISNPIRIRVNPTVTPAAIPIKKIGE